MKPASKDQIREAIDKTKHKWEPIIKRKANNGCYEIQSFILSTKYALVEAWLNENGHIMEPTREELTNFILEMEDSSCDVEICNYSAVMLEYPNG